jgi:O-antigen/teichoic acid export membrane protein
MRELIKNRKMVTSNLDASWSFIDQSMVSGVNFLTAILLARFLGVEAFGLYSLFWMAVLFINSIQFSIVSAPMFSLSHKYNKKVYFNSLFYIQIGVSSFIYIIGCIVTLIISDLYDFTVISNYVLPLCLAGFFFQNQDFIRRSLFCKKEYRNAFLNDVISYFGQLILLFILIYNESLSVTNVLYSIALSSAVASFTFLYKENFILVSYKKMLFFAKKHWEFGRWNLLSVIFQLISTNMIMIITSIVLGTKGVGILKLGQNIMGVMHIIFQAMENFVPSKASLKYRLGGFVELNKYKNQVLLLGLIFTSGVAFVITFLSDFILEIAYGAETLEYSYVLNAFAVIYIFMFINYPYNACLRAIENTRAMFLSQLFSTFLIALCSYPLIQRFEVKGALISLLIYYIATNIALHYLFQKRKV